MGIFIKAFYPEEYKYGDDNSGIDKGAFQAGLSVMGNCEPNGRDHTD